MTPRNLRELSSGAFGALQRRATRRRLVGGSVALGAATAAGGLGGGQTEAVPTASAPQDVAPVDRGPRGTVKPSTMPTEGAAIMAGNAEPNIQRVRLFPPPPKGFDALAATKRDLARHGLPQRPDPQTHPALAALWEQRMRRYRGFEFLEPRLLPADEPREALAAGLGLSALVSCGYELFHRRGTITMLTAVWTVPNLNNSPNAGLPNDFRTFVGLGFLDVHVEMTVDTAQDITTLIRIHTGDQVALPVRPGDAISATLCLQPDAAGTAFYGLVNETTAQIVNLTIETGFPPAVAINAGISRGSQFGGPPDPLARFGVVYFDELQAFATDGTPVLTDGVATSMVDSSGATLARPVKIADFTFKVIDERD